MQNKTRKVLLLNKALLISSSLFILLYNYCFFCSQLRTSRITLEESGIVAYQLKKREQNFTRMLTYIFARLFIVIPVNVYSILLLCFSYSLCTFPAAILELNDKTDIFFKSTSVPDWINISLFVLAMVPTSTNPLLYVVSDPKYRRLV